MINSHQRVWIWGTRLRLHYSWLLGFVLITGIVVTQFPEVYSILQRALLGIATSLLYFLALSIRELILLLLATSKGIPVKRVTLFVFGGVSQVTGQVTLPTLELLLAVVGLLLNFITVAAIYVVYSLLVNTGNVLLDGTIQWLSFIYTMLALLHFIPVFPLDAGRLMRVLLWKAIGDYDRATRVTTWAGQVVGWVLISGGIYLLTSHRWFSGTVLIFVGWVLQTAAAQSRQQVRQYQSLQDIITRGMMSKDYPVVNPQLSVGELIRDYILTTGQNSFVVADDVEFKGMITIGNLKRVRKSRRNSTTVSQVMIPLSKLRYVNSQQPASSVLEQMDDFEIEEMPVLENGKVVGIVQRNKLIRLSKTRAALKA